MKTKLSIVALLAIFLVAMTSIKKDKFDDAFIVGTPKVQSINKLAFGPNGVLFLGDSKSAAVFALDTQDNKDVEKATEVNISGFDKKIAEALGTEVSNINIQDMAVNPLSKTIYFSVHTGEGTPVLLKLNGENISNVSLENVKYSKTEINNAVAVDKKDRRGRSQRVWSISDLKYHNGKVMVSGLSNKEFSSTFRSVPFPFTDKQEQASLEIFHVAHNKFETHSPIKTFTVINANGKDNIIASYTCTPLVLFPIDDLEGGKHIKGKTVAELGYGNSPLDIISMEKEGRKFLLMSNTNRPLMKINHKDIVNFNGSLDVQKGKITSGVEYVSLPIVNIVQMDKLDATQYVMLQRKSDGDLILRTANNRWL